MRGEEATVAYLKCIS